MASVEPPRPSYLTRSPIARLSVAFDVGHVLLSKLVSTIERIRSLAAEPRMFQLVFVHRAVPARGYAFLVGDPDAALLKRAEMPS